MEILITDSNLVNDLHSLNILIDSYQAIITQYINSNHDITNDSFKIYQNEYYNNYNEFNNKKKELKTKYIDPILNSNNKYSWELNYDTSIVTINFQ